jgi:hypothetical protein
VIDDPKILSTQQLLNWVDRSDPVVKELCKRFEIQLEDLKHERVKRNNFKRELNSLMGMI